jgi:DNA-binding NtrC family response regulator
MPSKTQNQSSNALAAQRDTIIIADDDTSVISALQMLLKSQGYEVVAVTNPEAILAQVKSREFGAALIDLNYQNDTTSGKEGLALISALKALDETLPIVVMTGYSSIEIAVDAMKLGAGDFVQKPWSNERLLHILRTQIHLKNMQQKGNRLAHENALLKSEQLDNTLSVVAQSESMKAMLSQLKKLAQSDMSILFTGENGTGKSLFAQYIHEHSPRAKMPFISVNMGAVAETLFESEMFGHVKGAFTDAKDKRIGRFELAQSGTIFLDEIANISVSQQAKLLRVLEENQFEKVGSSVTQRVDVRVLSASNADIEQMIKDSDFRQDLFYRLNTITIHIPALRERIEDIKPLAEQFMQKHAAKYRMPVGRISETAIQHMLAYAWPGNIRELGHVIERAMFLRSGECIESKDLALPQSNSASDTHIHNEAASHLGQDWYDKTLDEIEKKLIQDRMLAYDNNPQLTATSLGLSRSAYYRRLEKYTLS